MRNSFFIVLLIVLFSPLIVHGFTTEAKNAVIIEAITGNILFEHNAYEEVQPSSMSKLMTLYIAFSKMKDGSLKENDLVTISTEAWKRGGSSMFLKEGQRIRVKDLITGIAVISGNDASIAIAEAIRGSQDDFAEEMNEYALHLELKNSKFLNSTGWPQEGHYMSVYDIALLARKIFIDFPEYYDVFLEPYVEMNGIKQSNTNQLIFKNNDDIKVDGMKTGHSESAGYGIAISAYNINGSRVFVVVNGLDSSKKRFTEAQRLINYAFDGFEFLTLYKKNEVIGNAKLLYGKEKRVPIAPDKDIFLVYKKTDKSNIKKEIEYYPEIKAPIKRGDKLARLIVTEPDGERRIVDLCATKDVQELSIIKKILYKMFALSNTKI